MSTGAERAVVVHGTAMLQRLKTKPPPVQDQAQHQPPRQPRKRRAKGKGKGKGKGKDKDRYRSKRTAGQPPAPIACKVKQRQAKVSKVAHNSARTSSLLQPRQACEPLVPVASAASQDLSNHRLPSTVQVTQGTQWYGHHMTPKVPTHPKSSKEQKDLQSPSRCQAQLCSVFCNKTIKEQWLKIKVFGQSRKVRTGNTVPKWRIYGVFTKNQSCQSVTMLSKYPQSPTNLLKTAKYFCSCKCMAT